MFFIHLIVFFIALFMMNYSGSKFKDKRSLSERILDIAVFLFCALIMGITLEGMFDNINL